MQNKVINHLWAHKIAYGLLAILLAVVGFALAQTPNFHDQSLSGNVGSLSASSVYFTSPTQASRFTVEQTVTVSFQKPTASEAKLYVVNMENKKERPITWASQVRESVYTQALPSSLKTGVTYAFGLQVGKSLALSQGTFTLYPSAPVTSPATSSSPSTVTSSPSSTEGVTLVTSEGVSIGTQAGQGVTFTMPATVTQGVTISLSSAISSVTPILVAQNVTGSFVWTVPATLSGAYKVNVTSTDGASISGLKVTVTDAATAVTSTQTSGVTSPLESNVSPSEVTFTSPSEAVTVAVSQPVVIAFTASNAEELFTLYAVEAATGVEVRLAKELTKGQSFTWVPQNAGTYNLVLAGEETQRVSPFTVSVTSGSTSPSAMTGSDSTIQVGSGVLRVGYNVPQGGGGLTYSTDDGEGGAHSFSECPLQGNYYTCAYINRPKGFYIIKFNEVDGFNTPPYQVVNFVGATVDVYGDYTSVNSTTKTSDSATPATVTNEDGFASTTELEVTAPVR